MSFMNPVDLVEEDAADLQFPKVEELPDTIAMREINTFATSGGSSAATASKQQKQKSSKVIMLKPTSDTKFTTSYYDPQALAEATQKVTDKTLLPSAYAETCYICKNVLLEPYIKCPECLVLLCVQCFAQGREKAAHRNTHSYIIVRDDIQVFPGSVGWTVREERVLLSTLQSSGYGNWDAVAKALRWQHTPDECRQHYHDCYFGGIFERVIGLTHATQTYFPERMPYVMKMRSIDPPRSDDISSMQSKIMAGYRCARGDFDTPYDVSAESLLTVINNDMQPWNSEGKDETGWDDVLVELRCALVRAYNNRLKERQRRYRIMRDNGLIMPNRTLGWISKYAEALGSEANCSRFLAFMQICKPVEFDKLVESMKYFTDLRKSIFRLYEMRKNGVRTLAGGELYFKLKKKRLMAQRERAKNERYQQIYNWRKLIPNPLGVTLNALSISNTTLGLNARKKAGPMEITALPGYTRLNDAERQLCSHARLYPQNYMDYKNLLVAENIKIGHLRLADARRLIKIDVNKTRQIYDFLIEHGHINKPT